ncbi:MAG: hypothetical protein HY515_03435, partial [Candidatus Aenigmarchaeota archaeon]|nr:hypothetical protein [Candidatus Aenigmarchaeota archaeon]
MRKAFLTLAVLFAIVFSTAVYAQNETGNQTQQPPPDPCAGVTCNSPPAAACDGNSVKTYSSPGTCSGGQCSYSSSTTSCKFGCSLGQCKPCEPSACGTNSKTCPDSFVATCQQTCSGGASDASCVACEPSCQGHETPVTSGSGSSGSGTSGGG